MEFIFSVQYKRAGRLGRSFLTLSLSTAVELSFINFHRLWLGFSLLLVSDEENLLAGLAQ